MNFSESCTNSEDLTKAKVDLRVTMTASKFVLVLRQKQIPFMDITLSSFQVRMESTDTNVTTFRGSLGAMEICQKRQDTCWKSIFSMKDNHDKSDQIITFHYKSFTPGIVSHPGYNTYFGKFLCLEFLGGLLGLSMSFLFF